MEEVWKVIPGFEGYSASSDGRVRNDKTGRVLKARKDEGGYMQIKLSVGRNKQVNKLVHHLVAGAFFPNPDGLPEVNHINRLRSNNRAENLEWISKDGNRAQRQLRPNDEQNGNRTAVWKCDKKTGAKLEMFRSLSDAAKAVGAKKPSGICDVLKERRKTAHGFKWISEKHHEIDNEIWKPLSPDLVNGVTGNFISSEGRIKNKFGTIRGGYVHSSGYTRICIGEKDFCVHRLVAQTFLPNFFGHQFVNHRDGDKKNPRLYNLEWNSPGQNARHAYDTGLNTARRPVRQFAMDGSFIADFKSIAEAIEVTGGTYSGISKSISTRSLTGNSRWVYIEEGEIATLPEFAGRVRPIRQLTMEGTKVADFANISKAAKSLGIDRHAFRIEVLRNDGVCAGFQWAFLT